MAADVWPLSPALVFQRFEAFTCLKCCFTLAVGFCPLQWYPVSAIASAWLQSSNLLIAPFYSSPICLLGLPALKNGGLTPFEKGRGKLGAATSLLNSSCASHAVPREGTLLSSSGFHDASVLVGGSIGFAICSSSSLGEVVIALFCIALRSMYQRCVTTLSCQAWPVAS